MTLAASPVMQLRKGVLAYFVLARLRGGRAYGREIAVELAHGSTWLISEGSLYPMLARLRRRGMVDAHWEESPVGPPRRYYELTATGAEELARFQRDWEAFASEVSVMIRGAR